MTLRTPQDRVWLEVAEMVEHGGDKGITWALSAWRPHLAPDHPALKILEEHRAYLRGERDPLDEDELAPLNVKLLEITLLAG